jgi:toxin ParE1/3/4
VPRYRETPEAREDLFSIWSYIDANNPPAADRVIAELSRACERLVDAPRMGRGRDELRPGLRSWVVAPYVVFYVIVEDSIEVVRVLHGARNIEAILSNRAP